MSFNDKINNFRNQGYTPKSISLTDRVINSFKKLTESVKTVYGILIPVIITDVATDVFNAFAKKDKEVERRYVRNKVLGLLTGVTTVLFVPILFTATRALVRVVRSGVGTSGKLIDQAI